MRPFTKALLVVALGMGVCTGAAADNWLGAQAQIKGGWVPAPSDQTSNYLQTRTIANEVTRHGTDESRSTDSLLTRTVEVVVGPWRDSGAPNACSEGGAGIWKPPVDKMPSGQQFTQKCNYLTERTREIKHLAEGKSILTRTQKRLVGTEVRRSAIGAREKFVPHNRSGTAWSNSGAAGDCGYWSPAADMQVSSFVQSRTCKQRQVRTVTDIVADVFSGKVKTDGTRTETRTVLAAQSRTVTVNHTGWIAAGGSTSCSAWTPASSTVDAGKSMTQSRTCTKPQQKLWEFSAQGQQLYNKNEFRTVNEAQSRSTTGTKARPGKLSAVTYTGTLVRRNFPSNARIEDINSDLMQMLTGVNIADQPGAPGAACSPAGHVFRWSGGAAVTRQINSYTWEYGMGYLVQNCLDQG